MSINDQRKSIRHLLDEQVVSDAQAVYYAFYHPDNKTHLTTYPSSTANAKGYVCLSRTGIDLFRPLITLRLPTQSGESQIDLKATSVLAEEAIPPNSDVIISSPYEYQPILDGLLTIQQARILKVLILEPHRYQPIINVLVTKADSPNRLPRYVIRNMGNDGSYGSNNVNASAGLNWQSPNFAEIYVHTKSSHRRQGYGRSVVSALAKEILDSGRIPIYVVDANNDASIQLAESVGFVETGVLWTLTEATTKKI